MNKNSKFNKDITQIKCPNCSGELQLKDKRTKTIVCSQCGAMSGFDKEKTALIFREDIGKLNHFSFLKVAQELNLDGIHYIIIGRTRWQSTYSERWEEEDEGRLEVGYDHNCRWAFDEWVLLSEQHTYLYLIENQNQNIYLAKSIYPANPAIPRNFNSPQMSQIDFNRKYSGFKDADEYGYTELAGVEGEATYDVALQERTYFWMYAASKQQYSVEIRIDEQKSIREIEYYVEKPISSYKLLLALAAYDEDLQSKLQAQKQLTRLISFLLISGVMALLVVYMVFTSQSKVLLQTSFEGNGIAKNIDGTKNNGEPVSTELPAIDGFVNEQLNKEVIYRKDASNFKKVNLQEGFYTFVINGAFSEWNGLEIMKEDSTVLTILEFDFQGSYTKDFQTYNSKDLKNLVLNYYSDYQQPKTAQLQIIKHPFYLKSHVLLIGGILFVVLGVFVLVFVNRNKF